jgi:hypothetical protein
MLLMPLALALMVSAPVSPNLARGGLVIKSAFAKHGADDPANHDVGDDRGRRHGGSGRGGADDPAGHH